jgi:hypothetical protein
MSNSKKIGLTITLLLSIALSISSLIVYTSEPGLGYLLIIYDSIGIFLLAVFSLMVSFDFKNQVHYALFVTSIVTSVPALLNSTSNNQMMISGMIISYIGITTLLYMVFSIWRPKQKS